NARHLCKKMMEKGYRIVSGGTDNHLFLVDLTNKGITGKTAQEALEKSGIMINKNLIPFDTKSPMITSGIRIGTPAITTRGMKEKEMEIIAELIDKVLKDPENEKVQKEVKEEVKRLCLTFPFYSKIYKI
ncbi:MAG TPA: serine hydroxymethyltransferase, partial [Syntrophorhabdaceae bacterium]|nr:serine hydroxymethyltransferase [Syntrophorhabdaceae bacterium]